MAGRWFRLDDDVVNDPKVQQLPDALFKAWINMLCIASKYDGRFPPLKDIAFVLRVDIGKATELLVKLVQAELVDKDEDGHFPHNWKGRQFISDAETSTQRSRTHREKKRLEREAAVAATQDATLQQRTSSNVAATDAATPPEQSRTDTEADQRQKEGTRAVALVLPPDWPADWFDRFWKMYPNRVDKAGALKSLTKAAKSGIAFQTIIEGLDRYVAKTDDRPWCNPTTWINQARWDEQHAEVRPHGQSKTSGSLIDAIDRDIERTLEEIDRASRHEGVVHLLPPGPVH